MEHLFQEVEGVANMRNIIMTSFVIVVLLFIGCHTDNNELLIADDSPASGEASIDSVIIIPETIESELKPEESAVITHEPSNSPSASIVMDPFDSQSVYPYTELNVKTNYEVTLARITKYSDRTDYTYYNQTMDFSNFNMEIVSFDPSSESEALRLKLSFPDSWDQMALEWMKRQGMLLQFELDGKPVNAFLERTVETLGNTQTIVYRKCLLDEYDLSGEHLSIRPFVRCDHKLMSLESTKCGFREINLSNGSEYTTSFCAGNYQKYNNRLIATEEDRFYLDHTAKTIVLHRSPITTIERPIDVRSIVFQAIDYEASKKAGAFREGEAESLIGTVYRKDVDFSQCSFVLDEFHIWNDEIKIAFTWYFPDEWANEECRSFVNDLQFFAYLDDELPKDLFGEDQPFGTGMFSWFDSVLNSFSLPNEENYQTMYFRFMNFQNWSSNLTVSEWRRHSTLTIVPFYYQNDSVVIPKDGITIKEYSDSLYSSFDLHGDTPITLTELAIVINLTDSIFEDGI
jgi:hypothetical protein